MYTFYLLLIKSQTKLYSEDTSQVYKMGEGTHKFLNGFFGRT